MLGHWQVKKKMPKRIAKLEMGGKKKKPTPQTPPRPIHSRFVQIHVKMFSIVSLLQAQFNSVPWGTTNPSVRVGKESNQFDILWNTRHKIKIKKQ